MEHCTALPLKMRSGFTSQTPFRDNRFTPVPDSLIP